MARAQVIAADAAPAGGPVAEGNTQLDTALAEQWAAQDKQALALVALIELCILLAGATSSTIGISGKLVTALAVSLELAALALATLRPRQYVRRWRLPLMTVTRTANMVLYPVFVDLLSIMVGHVVEVTGSGASNGAAARDELDGGIVAMLSAFVRGAALLVVPVAGVHACMLVALYWQLPPRFHLAVQAGSVAGLMWRTPKVCRQFVAVHPIHRMVAETVHWPLQQVASFACLGSREHLAAAAAATSPVHKCVTVAWTLQVSLGLVLSTLLVWRQQVQAAQKHTVLQRRRWRQRQREVSAAPPPPDSDSVSEEEEDPREELRRSQYARLCVPVLNAASAYGSWGVPVAAAALVGFIAALLVRQGAAAV